MVKSLFNIYPKKGEIWAIYRNWNGKWKQSDFYCNECNVVEITSDSCEEQHEVVRTMSLVQVPGYLTFFYREMSNGVLVSRMVSKN